MIETSKEAKDSIHCFNPKEAKHQKQCKRLRIMISIETISCFGDEPSVKSLFVMWSGGDGAQSWLANYDQSSYVTLSPLFSFEMVSDLISPIQTSISFLFIIRILC